MGEIFLAHLRGLAGFEKLVVIKRVLPHLAGEDRFRAMLLDEARIAALLSHPNVCQVQEVGEVEGEYYIAMEYLEGVTLADLLRRTAKREQVVAPRDGVAVIAQVCEGLHAAHELRDRRGQPMGLVHRDVSPSNVFLTTAGAAKMLDFGIAKTPDRLSQTRTGAIKGKWAYMSPEQILRQPLDRRSDVFALGIVLFEALTGLRLFYRKSEYEMCRAITETDAPPVRKYQPDLPPALGMVLARALARDPAQRFATAREMGMALLDASAGMGGPASPAHLAELVAGTFGPELAERRAFLEALDEGEGDGAGPGGGAGDGGAAAAELNAPSALPLAPVMTPDLPSGEESDLGLMRAVSEPRASSDMRAASEPPAATEPPSGSLVRSLAASSAQAAPQVPTPSAELSAPASPGAATGGARTRVRWLSALVTLALVGLGIAAFWLWPRGQDAQPRIETERGAVVFEGEGQDAGADADALAAADAPADAGAAGSAQPPEPDEPAARPRKRDRGERRKAASGSDFRRRVGQRGGALRACYEEHLRAGESFPLIELVMRIAPSGRVREASLAPARYQSQPLGRCLLGIVRGIDFGAQSAEVEVTIPLNFRLRRGD
ncbi:serine/threonine protein kinase [Haliangium ochraceum DSM 14365]|uniref:Serine/threonine protein kinase n=2 Tax=Haliangium ochraceum TaxID=80816 RepID=D0LRG0_HALO1|nr:serine/threonine protein kinase [Haliangium ochraceum DSM 14365]